MWYKVNWKILTLNWLPTMLRKNFTKAFMTVVVLPVSQLYDRWRTLRDRNIYKMQHNGQVCYLRKALNDTFDLEERRIYIDDGLYKDPVYLNPIVSNKPKYLGTLFINPNRFHSGEYDFWVYVPAAIVNAKNYELRALIDFYKEGAKKYTIQEI